MLSQTKIKLKDDIKSIISAGAQSSMYNAIMAIYSPVSADSNDPAGAGPKMSNNAKKEIENGSKKLADTFSKEFADNISEKLAEAIYKFVISADITIMAPVPGAASLTSPVGGVTGNLTINPKMVKIS